MIGFFVIRIINVYRPIEIAFYPAIKSHPRLYAAVDERAVGMMIRERIFRRVATVPPTFTTERRELFGFVNILG